MLSNLNIHYIKSVCCDKTCICVNYHMICNCKNCKCSSTGFNMRKLQCIQNTLGRIVTNCNIYSLNTTPILKKLHQLTVEFQCIFKTATLVYKFLHSCHPSYFSPHLSIRCGRYCTRYNRPDKRFLEVSSILPISRQIQKTLWSQFCF